MNNLALCLLLFVLSKSLGYVKLSRCALAVTLQSYGTPSRSTCPRRVQGLLASSDAFPDNFDKFQMQRKQKMRLSQLALVPYDKDEKRPRSE
ncbi:hypothetical protein KY284_010569 [Solanum tuberosum]|nr:hypothetical protein KY284_010569 [Solanum tuberosum]